MKVLWILCVCVVWWCVGFFFWLGDGGGGAGVELALGI